MYYKHNFTGTILVEVPIALQLLHLKDQSLRRMIALFFVCQ